MKGRTSEDAGRRNRGPSMIWYEILGYVWIYAERKTNAKRARGKSCGRDGVESGERSGRDQGVLFQGELLHMYTMEGTEGEIISGWRELEGKERGEVEDGEREVWSKGRGEDTREMPRRV